MENKETALLAGIIFSDQTLEKAKSSLRELSLLTETAQAQVLATITQRREREDPALLMGKGKVKEIEQVVQELEIDLVIFNHELSPSQLKNLEKHLSCKVIDRTQLILDIFAKRARSKEGQLQVELAQLNYLLPRLVGRTSHLSRLGGGIGTRGPGEKKLETERRHIRRRMREIEKELKRVAAYRQHYRVRRKRNQVYQVALVGYTNAGKSTLLNQLTNADAYTENLLFATLDTTTKQLPISSGLQLVISDTVGFIQDLPTTLIAAFSSTLEEVGEADLILHIIDSSDPEYLDHMQVVDDLLQQLGAGHTPTLSVFTKKDAPPAPGLFVGQEAEYISSFKRHDIERLRQRILREWEAQLEHVQVYLPAHAMDLIPKCRQVGWIKEEKWLEDQDTLFLSLFLPKHHPYIDQLRPFCN